MTPMHEQTVTHVKTFSGHTDVVTSIVMIPSMDVMMTASLDCNVLMWDLVHGQLKAVFSGHDAGTGVTWHSLSLWQDYC